MKGDRDQVSKQEVMIFRTLRGAVAWTTSAALARAATVAGSTARLHLRRYVALGLVDVVQLHPGHRYRWVSKVPAGAAAAYLKRLKRASDILLILPLPGSVVAKLEAYAAKLEAESLGLSGSRSEVTSRAIHEFLSRATVSPSKE